MNRVFILFIIVTMHLLGSGFPSYYYNIKNIKKQKREFIKILVPLVKKANDEVKKERKFIKEFFKTAIEDDFRYLDSESLRKLLYLAQKYRIKNLFDRDEYLMKIDTVPISLAITQGAIESAWGKSRFVREANNIFGHWTYGENGLIPNEREEGKTHKIRIFNSLQSSVNAYVLNLNRNKAYELFRKKRYQAHKKNMVYNGLMAAKTMINYSELKEKYIKILVKMMKKDNLLYYDNL